VRGKLDGKNFVHGKIVYMLPEGDLLKGLKGGIWGCLRAGDKEFLKVGCRFVRRRRRKLNVL
jgi:hypothetical protein